MIVMFLAPGLQTNLDPPPSIKLSSGPPERHLPTWNIFYVKPLSHRDASDSHGGCYTSEALDFNFGLVLLDFPDMG